MLREWLHRLLGTLRVWRRDDDIEEELRTHLELAIEHAPHRGTTADDAARAVRIQAGGVAQAMEAMRDQRGIPWMEGLTADVRHSLRTLRRSPAFALIALTTLALGIGANTAIFSMVNGVLLRPLPHRSPDRLMYLTTRLTTPIGSPKESVSPPEYLEFRELTRSFASVGAFATGEVNLTAGDRPLRVRSASVNEDLLDTLAIQPAQGRLFAKGETDARGALPPPIAMLSHELWQTAFGGQPVVGRAIEVDGRPHEVIGILPPGADVIDIRVEIWLPLGLDPSNRLNRGAHYLHVIGRLNDGVAMQAARSELDGLIASWSARVGIPLGPGAAGHVFRPLTTGGGHLLQMRPLRDEILGGASRAIWILQASVGLVLLIACANLASVLLARGEMRQHEFVLRKALGASRARLLRQFIIDGVLLSIAGGALALWLARVGLSALIAAHPTSLPRTSEVTIDWRVLLFTLGAATITGVIVGLAPYVYLRAESLVGALYAGSKGATVTARHRIRRGLVVAEVALAGVLAVGAGLLARTVYNLTHVDAGFDRSRLVTFSLTLPQADYPLPSTRAQLYGRVLDRLRALPGVEAATAVSGLPPNSPEIGANTDIEGYSAPPQGPIEIVDYYQYVMSTYFETMGIPLVAGRGFEQTDAVSSEMVAVVNQTFVKTFLKGQNPIGRRLRRCGRCNDDDPWFTVIGVAKDVKQRGLDRDAGTEVYTFVGQAAIRRRFNLAPGTMSVVMRTSLPPAGLSGAIARVVREADPSVPIVRLRDMEAVFAESIGRPRLLATLVGAFGGLALLLAALGTYGVLAHMTAERRREIGIRMALGAGRARVLRQVMMHGLVLTVAGVVIGLAAAIGLNRFATSLLFDVTPTDPTTLITVAATMILSACSACWLPAWRASRLDPNVTLRFD